MTALKRSLVYLKRKHKRSVLLFLLLFVISCSISIGLSVWHNIGDAIKEIEKSLGTGINLKLAQGIQMNEMFLMGVPDRDGDTIIRYYGPTLRQDMIHQILEEVDGITHYNAENDAYCYLDELQLIPGLWNYGVKRDLENPDSIASSGNVTPELRIMYSRFTTIFGNTDSSLYAPFRTGTFELIEGRHVVSENDRGKVLISDELAKLNGLKIGDTFDVSVCAGFVKYAEDPLKRWAEPQELEIIGIFHVNGYQPVNKWVAESDCTYNYIFTDIETVEHLYRMQFAENHENLPELYYRNVAFFIDDPAQLPAILDQIQNLQCIETQYYDITLDDTMYKSTTDALRNIRNIVMVLVAVIVAGCAVVLLIVFTMWVRSRRQEISIHLSMGLSKASILGQFVLEAAIIAVLAGVLAFGVCQEVPNMIGNYMLADAIEDAQPDWEEPTREEIHQAAMSGTTHELFQYTNSEYAGPEQIDFAFHFTDFLVLILLELLLITAAILKGGWFIFNMQPRKIMTDLR